MIKKGVHVGAFGLFFYAGNLWDEKAIYLTPGVKMEAVKGIDRYFHIAFCFLIFYFGIRFIWINKNFNYL